MAIKPSFSANDPKSRGGLFRRFILPQVLIAIAAGALGLLWAATQQRVQDHERMAKVAAANAVFLENLKLPRSRQMADNLSVVTSSKVGFFIPGQGLVEGWDWTDDERAAARLANESQPEIAVTRGFNALVQPIADGRGSIVVIEPVGPLIALSNSSSVIPLLGMTLLAIAGAFLIARSVVRPLQKLAANVFSAPAETEMILPDRLTKRHDEIGILARTLTQERNALIDEQERRRNSEKMALLGHLATSLAHEIKNPAAAIIMHAKAMEDHDQNSSGKLIREEGEHITSLVNQWLFVAKPEAPRSSETDLVKLLLALKSRLQAMLDFHRCTLVLKLPDSLPISCDAQRIEQVFRNLIDNAIKAMPNGGKISLELKQGAGDCAEFTLRDEGQGFSVKALEHFGETFYSEREGGMGLGLALATGVVKAHGGVLSAQNTHEGGALISGTLKANPTTL